MTIMTHPPLFNLSGLNALVCGASQGIGRATADLFAKQGARVILLARNLEKLESVKGQLTNPDLHLCVSADLSKPTEVALALQTIQKKIGTVHILVNNAGCPPSGPLMEAQGAAFEAALTTHILSQLQLCQALVPDMKAEGFGRIINIISTSVRAPIQGLGVSNTIRAAVAGFAKNIVQRTRTACDHGEQHSPRIHAHRAPQIARAGGRCARWKDGKSSDEVMNSWLAQIPMRRFAQPAEVAEGLAFLASREAGYITGVSLQIDGGRISSI